MNKLRSKSHKSNWGSIIIRGDNPHVYKLDENGCLIEKFPKLKPRKGLFQQVDTKSKRSGTNSFHQSTPIQDTTVNATNDQASTKVKIDNESFITNFDEYSDSFFNPEDDDLNFIDTPFDFNQNLNFNFDFMGQSTNEYYYNI